MKVSFTSQNDLTMQLIDEINVVLENHHVNDVKDALLTLITWWIADMKPVMNCSVNEFIDILAESLKESVDIQLQMIESETATKQ